MYRYVCLYIVYQLACDFYFYPNRRCFKVHIFTYLLKLLIRAYMSSTLLNRF